MVFPPITPRSALSVTCFNVAVVDEGNRGVVLRFGKYVDTTQPGLNWHFPSPVESKSGGPLSSLRPLQGSLFLSPPGSFQDIL
jgi:hypothetical protein